MTTGNSDKSHDALDRIMDLVEGIAESTMASTDTIMTVCESLPQPEMAEPVAAIYKACAVQDLTNQRLMKIMTLITQLRTGEYHDEDALLEGPQRHHKGLSQEMIDGLLDDGE